MKTIDVSRSDADVYYHVCIISVELVPESQIPRKTSKPASVSPVFGDFI